MRKKVTIFLRKRRRRVANTIPSGVGCTVLPVRWKAKVRLAEREAALPKKRRKCLTFVNTRPSPPKFNGRHARMPEFYNRRTDGRRVDVEW